MSRLCGQDWRTRLVTTNTVSYATAKVTAQGETYNGVNMRTNELLIDLHSSGGDWTLRNNSMVENICFKYHNATWWPILR